jgi:hypothetical protein
VELGLLVMLVVWTVAQWSLGTVMGNYALELEEAAFETKQICKVETGMSARYSDEKVVEDETAQPHSPAPRTSEPPFRDSF